MNRSLEVTTSLPELEKMLAITSARCTKTYQPELFGIIDGRNMRYVNTSIA